MADIADNTRAEFEKQIADLRKEMDKIGKSIAAQASDAADDAEDVYDDMKGRASKVARRVRRQGHLAADVARENPGTTATVLSTVGLFGLAIGLVLGGLFAGNGRRR